MKVAFVIAALLALSPSASAQHVFGGCPQPQIVKLTAPAKKKRTCASAFQVDPQSLADCGVELGDKDALPVAPDVTARLANDREKRRTVVELRAGNKTIGRWATDGGPLIECASGVVMSADRKTLAVELVLDKRTLTSEREMYRIVVFQLAAPLPTPKH